MKRELLKIAKDLDKEKITEEKARDLLLGLLGAKIVACCIVLNLILYKHFVCSTPYTTYYTL